MQACFFARRHPRPDRYVYKLVLVSKMSIQQLAHIPVSDGAASAMSLYAIRRPVKQEVEGMQKSAGL